MKIKRKQPLIRFKGFNEDWEEKKLGDIGKTFNGLSGKTKKDFGHGEARYITYMNVNRNAISDIDGLDKIEIDNSQNEVKYGDIFFTTSSETPEEVGLSSVWLHNVDNIYLNSFCFGYRLTEYINPLFLAYLFRSNYFRSKAILLAQGISRYNISKKQLMKITISISEKSEQAKIGNLINNLDKLISLQEQKLELLEQVKKGLLQKLFPKKGSKIPEIRFRGFEGEWGEKKLGEIADIKGGGTPSTKNSDYWNGNINWYSPVEIDNQIFISSSQKKITEEGLKNSSAKILPIGTVLFTSRAGIGKTAILKEPGSTNQGFQSIVPKKSQLDSYFIYSRTKELKRYAETVGAGSTFLEVSGRQMKKMKIKIPEIYDEQIKISNVYKNLDELISSQEQKLQQLQAMKQSLLQQMFI